MARVGARPGLDRRRLNLGRLLRSITPDLAPLRESRDYRLLIIGMAVTGLGTQAALVALPYQVYVTTHEPVLVGLIGLVELGPLIAASLVGGAYADRVDRRKLLLLCQIALVAVSGGLAAAAFRGSPPSGCSTCWPPRWPRPGRSSASAARRSCRTWCGRNRSARRSPPASASPS